MDAAERMRLKKLGKQMAEQRSRELREQLRMANPAPIGTDAWVRNYKAAVARERRIRAEQPDLIPAEVAAREFVLQPVAGVPEFVPTWYVECPRCGDLLHTAPRKTVRCTCGSVQLQLNLETLELSLQAERQPRWVRLLGRGNPRQRQGGG